MGYTFIAYVGILLENSSLTGKVINELTSIPEVTVAHLTTGKFTVFCKLRAKDTKTC